MARRGPVGIRLLTRRGNDWSSRFPLIVEAVNHLRVRSCLIVAMSEASRCSMCSGTAGTSRRRSSTPGSLSSSAPIFLGLPAAPPVRAGSQGTQYQISRDGIPRSYCGRKDIALQTARFSKSRNPNSTVTLKDLQTGEETVVAFSRQNGQAMIDIPRAHASANVVGDPPANETEHFIRCSACSGWIDCRDLAQVCEHAAHPAGPTAINGHAPHDAQDGHASPVSKTSRTTFCSVADGRSAEFMKKEAGCAWGTTCCCTSMAR